LAYLPGRTILIDEADLDAYIDSIRVAQTLKISGGVDKKPPEDAAARARRKWLLREMRKKAAK